MTRLVLHAGAEFVDGGAVQRDLVAWREPLAAAGVMLPTGSGRTAWRETGRGLTRRQMSESASTLLQAAEEASADVVLVSADALADVLASPTDVAALVDRAAALRLGIRVVVVVREQIGYINSLYCRRVLTLDTARDFPDFARNTVPAHRFDYVASFGAVADAEGIELVAVPYSDLLSAGPARAVLRAAALPDETFAGLPANGTAPAPLPGPVLISACRLLHKRLRRLGLFTEVGKPRLRRLVEQLEAHADEAGWDTSRFWGWDRGLRHEIEEEYRLSNEMFADYVWGRPWAEPWSTGTPARVDLADVSPAVLRDVLTTVDQLLAGARQVPDVKAGSEDVRDDRYDDEDAADKEAAEEDQGGAGEG